MVGLRLRNSLVVNSPAMTGWLWPLAGGRQSSLVITSGPPASLRLFRTRVVSPTVRWTAACMRSSSRKTPVGQGLLLYRLR